MEGSILEPHAFHAQRLRQECVERPHVCVHNEWFGRTEEMFNLTGSFDAAESIKRAIRDTGRSYFCMQPPGDTFSRWGTALSNTYIYAVPILNHCVLLCY